MALVYADRVQETSTTTGTGTYTLAGAVADFQSFAAIGDGNTCYYAAVMAGGGWEVGLGTYTAAGTTLARTRITASSNAGAAVSWGAGTKNIFCTIPAERVITPRAVVVKTSGTTYTTPAGCSLILVEVVGGGGAGGSGGGGVGAGGGGGGGGYARKLYTVTPSTGYTYAVGAAGANSTFTDGVTLITGGLGAVGGAASASGVAGGNGGTGTNGDVNLSGGKGAPGLGSTGTIGAQGGSSGFGMGAGGAGGIEGGAGVAGALYGGGGGGAGEASATGGAGAAGVVIITEYY